MGRAVSRSARQHDRGGAALLLVFTATLSDCACGVRRTRDDVSAAVTWVSNGIVQFLMLAVYAERLLMLVWVTHITLTWRFLSVWMRGDC